MKIQFFIAVVSVLFSTAVFASTITAVTGASNAVVDPTGQKPTVIYYSNITNQLDLTQLYYIGDKDGATCSTIINKNCKTADDTLGISLQISGTSSSRANVHLVYSQYRPSPGDNLDNFTHVAAWRVGGKTKPVAFQTTWANLCSTVAASKYPVEGLGTRCQDQSELLGSHSFTLWAVVDSAGNNTVGTDVMQIDVVFMSSIPATTSGGLGIYDFKVAAGHGSVDLTDVQVDTLEYPGIINGIGALHAQLYYAKAGGAVAMNNFNSVGPTSASPTETDIALPSGDGTMQTHFDGFTPGATYYFRVAVVDNAGNIGYLTVDDNSDRVATILP